MSQSLAAIITSSIKTQLEVNPNQAVAPMLNTQVLPRVEGWVACTEVTPRFSENSLLSLETRPREETQLPRIFPNNANSTLQPLYADEFTLPAFPQNPADLESSSFLVKTREGDSQNFDIAKQLSRLNAEQQKQIKQLEDELIQRQLQLLNLRKNKAPRFQKPKRVNIKTHVREKKELKIPYSILLRKQNLRQSKSFSNSVVDVVKIKMAVEKNHIKELKKLFPNNSTLIQKIIIQEKLIETAILKVEHPLDMVNFLLSYKPQLNILDLVLAFEKNMAIFKLIYKNLIDRKIITGIDHPIPNTRNATFLQLTVARNQYDFTDYLLREGADAYKADSDGKTAFYFTLENGNQAILKLLLDHTRIKTDHLKNRYAQELEGGMVVLNNLIRTNKALSERHRATLRTFLKERGENLLMSNLPIKQTNKKSNYQAAIATNPKPLDLVVDTEGLPVKDKLNITIPILNMVNFWHDKNRAIQREMEVTLGTNRFSQRHGHLNKELIGIISNYIVFSGSNEYAEYSSEPRSKAFWENIQSYHSPFEAETVTTLFRRHKANNRQDKKSRKKQNDDLNITPELLESFISFVKREIDSLPQEMIHAEKINEILIKALGNLHFVIYKDANLFVGANVLNLVRLAIQFNDKLPHNLQSETNDELLEEIVLQVMINTYDDVSLVKVCQDLQLAKKIKLPILDDINHKMINGVIQSNEDKQKLRQFLLEHGKGPILNKLKVLLAIIEKENLQEKSQTKSMALT